MKRGIIYAALIGLTAVAAYLYLLHRGHKVDQQIAAPVLGPDDRAKIILDNAHHTITRIDDTGVHKTFLNTHGPVAIIEKKNGQTVLIQRTWGAEFSPYIGGAFGSDFKFRAALGVNLFYLQRWETGGGLLLNPSQIKDVRPYVAVGYNVYSNWFISTGIDNHKTVRVIASLRF